MWKIIFCHVILKRSVNSDQRARPILKFLIDLSAMTILYVTFCVHGSFFLGTMIMGNANLHAEREIITAFSEFATSFLNQAWCQSGNLYNFLSNGLMFPLGIKVICTRFVYQCQWGVWGCQCTCHLTYIAYLLFGLEL